QSKALGAEAPLPIIVQILADAARWNELFRRRRMAVASGAFVRGNPVDVIDGAVCVAIENMLLIKRDHGGGSARRARRVGKRGPVLEDRHSGTGSPEDVIDRATGTAIEDVLLTVGDHGGGIARRARRVGERGPLLKVEAIVRRIPE